MNTDFGPILQQMELVRNGSHDSWAVSKNAIRTTAKNAVIETWPFFSPWGKPEFHTSSNEITTSQTRGSTVKVQITKVQTTKGVRDYKIVEIKHPTWGAATRANMVTNKLDLNYIYLGEQTKAPPPMSRNSGYQIFYSRLYAVDIHIHRCINTQNLEGEYRVE